MASFDAHVELVRQNRKLLDNHLIPVVNDHPDWVAVVAFYTALHMVEAALYFDHPGRGCRDHDERQAVLERRPYTHIWEHYRLLYSASRVARYLSPIGSRSFPSFRAYHRPEKVVSHLIDYELAKVCEHCERIIQKYRPEFRFFPPVTPPPPPAS